MILLAAHLVLSLAITSPDTTVQGRGLSILDMAVVEKVVAEVRPGIERRARFQGATQTGWLPWAGAAVGATLVGVGVADEEDLVRSGKLMWIGIGAAAGAAAGWIIGKLADR